MLKSRGMAHSNQIREFVLTDHGVDLLDVYGLEGVLTGTSAGEKALARSRRVDPPEARADDPARRRGPNPRAAWRRARQASGPEVRGTMTKMRRSVKPRPSPRDGNGRQARSRHAETWQLRLYVAGRSPKSVAAYANLVRICEEHLGGRYTIEVVDLLKNPHLARGDQIVAIPTLVRKLPQPMRKIVGDLSNTDQTLVGLQLRPQPPS